MGLRLRAALTMLVAAVSVLALAPATAGASAPAGALPPPVTFDVTAHPTTASSARGAQSGIQQATVIVCSISVQNPHPSSHVGGTVNVIARTQCSAPVASLEMVMALARNGTIVGEKTNSNAGSSSLQNNVAVPCVSGTYQGAAEAGIVFPAGFEPPTGIIANVSALVPIKC